jgi:uncharacterized repeat protein (TIGR01451 family)
MGIKIRIDENNGGKSDLAQKLTDKNSKIEKELEEKRDSEIEDSLSEIYRDSRGEKIDVNRMKIRRKQGMVFWFFNILVFTLIILVLGFGAFYYVFYNHGTDSTAVDLQISAPSSVSAGEEMTYVVSYTNQEYVSLRNVNIKLDYPNNFIFESADLQPDVNNDTWNISEISARSSNKITIKGKVIDKAGAASIVLAQMLYTPDNFSSQFKKEDSANTIIKDVGLDASFNFSNTVLVGEEEIINIDLKPLDNAYLSQFTVRMQKDDNVQLEDTVVDNGATGAENGNSLQVEKVKDATSNLWLVSGLQKKEENFTIKYRIKNKTADNQNIILTFENSVDGKNYTFLEQDIPLTIMKSDLNLTLTLRNENNDPDNNQSVNFGQTLNYSIAYTNKGEGAMQDVVVMAVLNSDFLNWTTLKDINKGREVGNTITWTKDNIPALAKIDAGAQGTIDFSIGVLPFNETDLGKSFKIISYAQYSLGGLSSAVASSSTSSTASSIDNQSNTINTPINTDLTFKEQVRYFDENNLPVGEGPLPPTVGQTTNFKVYWNISNDVNDLNNVVVQTVLPDGVEWSAHNRTSVGTLAYDGSTKTVTWQIGRLPITVPLASAEFDIGLTPSESQRNKIVVLVSGSKVTGIDSVTSASMEKDSVPKTTKLDDDSIAGMSSDGRVK